MKKTNILLLIAVILLMIISLFMIYSASFVWASYKFNNLFKYTINQAIFSLIGIIMLFILSKINYQFSYKKAHMYFYYIHVILLK